MKNKSSISKTLITILAIILAIIVLIVTWGITTSNNLMTLREDVKMQQSQVETTLQRRSDLIPNLVNTVKGYATHEEEVFTEIADARSKLAGSIESGDLDSISKSNSELDSALSRLLAITENYPDLKASEQFTALQDELAGTENRINVARQHYNEKVMTYNTSVQRFPTSIIAGIFGYSPAEYFEASEEAQKVPEVNFN